MEKGIKVINLNGIEKMVIVKIWGGLGNQMFQYAAAKSLAISHNAKLKLDVTSYSKQVPSETPREWALNIFRNIEDEICNLSDTNPVLPHFPNDFIKRVYKFAVKKFGWINRKYLIERNYSYSQLPFNDSIVYMDGYWQSYKYFAKYEYLIKQKFDLSYLEKEVTLQEYIKAIRSTVSVSLHVRRGDYLLNAQISSFHEVCNEDYFYAAIKKVAALENEQIRIFVFSDDLEWCRDNMKIKEDHLFIKTNSAEHDLYLMSICKHNIIANSTFSWWAAWLNNNLQKIVIAPGKWHKGIKENNNDLLPENWIKLD